MPVSDDGVITTIIDKTIAHIQTGIENRFSQINQQPLNSHSTDIIVTHAISESELHFGLSR